MQDTPELLQRGKVPKEGGHTAVLQNLCKCAIVLIPKGEAIL